jgi:hypothetical protein
LRVISRKPFAGGWEYLLEHPIVTVPPVNNWSGSALIDADGRLVGIGSLVVDDDATERLECPAICSCRWICSSRSLRISVAQGGVVRLHPLGWACPPQQARGQLVVTRVAPEGPADEAGVRSGDRVLAVGGVQVADTVDFYRRVQGAGPPARRWRSAWAGRRYPGRDDSIGGPGSTCCASRARDLTTGSSVDSDGPAMTAINPAAQACQASRGSTPSRWSRPSNWSADENSIVRRPAPPRRPPTHRRRQYISDALLEPGESRSAGGALRVPGRRGAPDRRSGRG